MPCIICKSRIAEEDFAKGNYKWFEEDQNGIFQCIVRYRLAPTHTTVKRLEQARADDQAFIDRQKKCIDLLNGEISNYQQKLKSIHDISLSRTGRHTKNKSWMQ